MPKKCTEMSDAKVRRLKHKIVNGKPVKVTYAVGGVSGLLLQCKPPVPGREMGARSWILRTMVGEKRRDIGLGGYPDVTLSGAREKAREIKKRITEEAIDPVAHRKALKSALIREQAKAVTFEQAAAPYLKKKATEYKNRSQVIKLENQMKRYVYPIIGNMIVGDIEFAHIVKVISPIWETKNDTAGRIRLHIERILHLAKLDGQRDGDNPAQWTGALKEKLAKRSKVASTKSHPALPVEQLPDFLKELKTKKGVAARALEFIIYTAARSGEVRWAEWQEIDLHARTWTIPAEKMKANKEHIIPLNDDAVKLLSGMPEISTFVFAAPRTNQALSDVSVSKITKPYEITPHGFRSTFKDWCRKYTNYPDEVSELQLAHVNNDKTRAAYARDGLLDRRRLLMTEWMTFCRKGITSKVVGINAKKG